MLNEQVEELQRPLSTHCRHYRWLRQASRDLARFCFQRSNYVGSRSRLRLHSAAFWWLGPQLRSSVYRPLGAHDGRADAYAILISAFRPFRTLDAGGPAFAIANTRYGQMEPAAVRVSGSHRRQDSQPCASTAAPGTAQSLRQLAQVARTGKPDDFEPAQRPGGAAIRAVNLHRRLKAAQVAGRANVLGRHFDRLERAERFGNIQTRTRLRTTK